MNKHFKFPFIIIFFFQINRIHFPFLFWSILEILLKTRLIFPILFWTFKPLWLLLCQMSSQPNKCSQIRTSLIEIQIKAMFWFKIVNNKNTHIKQHQGWQKWRNKKIKWECWQDWRWQALILQGLYQKNTRVENFRLYICWTKGWWENIVW
jgi:hypothetical protein